MELQDFIAQCLIQICTGISNARKEVGEAIATGAQASGGMIKFEISCTVLSHAVKNRDSKIGFFLEVLSGNVNKKTEDSTANQAIQRISFDVPYSPSDAANYCLHKKIQ